MNRSAKTMLATATALALASATASAGPCSQQIADLTKQMAEIDAGTGPIKPSPPPVAGEREGQHPPTTLMSKQTEDRAISPRDVQRQSGIRTNASDALALARKLDGQNRPECRDAADIAGRLLTLR